MATSTIEITQNQDLSYVRFAGPINEESGPGLLAILDKIQSNCVLNLRGFEYINSVGLRCWMTFITNLCQSRNVVLEECAFEFVLQINMINALLGKATVSSVCAMYYCENCSHEETVIYQTEELKKKSTTEIQSKTCLQCGHDSELGEDAGIFIHFLAEGANS